MKWEQVRDNYPNTWVLFEAIVAHSEQGKRIIEDMAVLNTFESGTEAMRKYIELHKQNPERELFIFSTSNKELEIKEKLWMGVRRA
ncbi:MAG: hypothetical protein HPY74_01675 [Firmicutes bacterium]|nr:hypothetical protein [Bacillota bacterium]